MRGARVILLVLVAGCGSDPTPPQRPDDAAVPDGPRGWPEDPGEGGEVRVEYVRFANGDASARVTAFLYKSPGSTKFFPYPSLNSCTDSSKKTHWPTATNPIGERVYQDPGEVIIAGGPEPLRVARRDVQGNDPFGRTHPANQWAFHFGGANAMDGATYLPEKTKLDVIFTGSADMPGQIFDDVLYMPAAFDVTTPGTDPVELVAGTDLTLNWETPDSGEPTGYDVLSLVAFTGANGPVVLCIEPNDGSITIPAEMVDIGRAMYPGGGTLARQILTHVVRELHDRSGPTGRRIDFVTVWGHETAFTVQ